METLEVLEVFGKELLEYLKPVEKADVYYNLSMDSQTLAIYIFPKNIQKVLGVHVYSPDKEGERLLVISNHYEERARIEGEKVLEKFMQALKNDFQVEQKRKYRDEHLWFIEKGYLVIRRI